MASRVVAWIRNEAKFAADGLFATDDARLFGFNEGLLTAMAAFACAVGERCLSDELLRTLDSAPKEGAAMKTTDEYEAEIESLRLAISEYRSQIVALTKTVDEFRAAASARDFDTRCHCGCPEEMHARAACEECECELYQPRSGIHCNEATPPQWYVYDPEDGIDRCSTAAEAKGRAEKIMQDESDRAAVDGWRENIGDLEWGALVCYGRACCVKTQDAPDGSDFDEIQDWALR